MAELTEEEMLENLAKFIKENKPSNEEILKAFNVEQVKKDFPKYNVEVNHAEPFERGFIKVTNDKGRHIICNFGQFGELMAMHSINIYEEIKRLISHELSLEGKDFDKFDNKENTK